MKTLKYFNLFLIIISIWACSSKPEPNLELFNGEAFAYEIGDSWEVNATINAKGFLQKEVENIYHFNLSYSVDLITPEGDSLNSIFNDIVEEKNKEEIIDVPLEAQIEIDSTFSSGKYALVFNVRDEFAKQTKSVNVSFNLVK